MATPYHKSSLKPGDVIRETFRTDKRNAIYVRPMQLKVKPWGYEMITITKKPKEEMRKHLVKCEMPPDYEGSFKRAQGIKLDCDCQRHVFVWNYALNRANAAIKDRTNGEPPVVTNPWEKTGGCKHITVFLATMVKVNPYWPDRRIGKRDPTAKPKTVVLKTTKL